MRDLRVTRIVSGTIVLASAVVLALWPLFNHDAYKQNVILLAFLIGVIAVGWNIISGFAGYVSLGQSAFIGIGAYTAGILAQHVGSSTLPVWKWWYVPVGGVIAAAIAVLLGAIVMRVRGHSFVILTIAFLFIMRLLATNWTSLTNGANGMSFPLARYPLKWQNTPFYYALFVLLVLSVLLAWAVRRAKFGMGLIAIREDENKAGAVGVSTPAYKLLAFAASAIFVGMAGAVFGYYLSYINPDGMFDIVLSVQAVLAVLLGGRATILGPVLGAGLIEFISEATNDRTYGIAGAHVHIGGQWRLIVFGGLMAATVLFLPRGIIPTSSEFLERRRSRRRAAPEGVVDLRPARLAATAPAIERDGAGGRILLEVKNLRKSFGGVRAVDDLSFTVREGTITALIGPNGSGKTTAFNLIDGLMRPDEGEVWFDGRRIDRLRPWRRAHFGLGRTFQITRLFREMTVLENVVAPLREFRWRQLAADAVAGHEAERAEELLEFVGMRAFADERAGRLSFGQQKLVELAQILMVDPKLILLDEPAGGINPTLVERIVEKIRALNDGGKTFLIVEHNIPLVADLCDPVIVLARGTCIASGTAAQIQRDPLVLDAYLGEGWTVEEAVTA
jgi:ABC-type branched-subunit amino acid transport system ATPase component/ABC-type branched-subunit amino acid transport system permease subunit